jgi:hypothetical protein
MLHIIRPLTCSTLALALAALAPPLAAEICPGTSYGAGVTLEATTATSDILAEPRRWEGETVRIEGEVRDVCAMAGCWMALAAGGDEEALRVKVKDGEMVFPLSARGHRAIAEGTVEVRELSAEEAAAFDGHLAEERGEVLDESSAPSVPRLLVQVRGTGAVVCAGP